MNKNDPLGLNLRQLQQQALSLTYVVRGPRRIAKYHVISEQLMHGHPVTTRLLRSLSRFTSSQFSEYKLYMSNNSGHIVSYISSLFYKIASCTPTPW